MTLLAMHPILHQLLPEICLAGGALLILLLGSISGRSRSSFLLTLVAMFAAIWAASHVQQHPAGAVPLPQAESSAPTLQHDALVYYTRLITLALGALILLANRHVPAETERAEFFSLVLFSLSGIMLVADANDLVSLFLALELVSVPTYILVGLSRTDLRAQEATGKYFFLGSFAAAITLYGFSFLYAAAGTTQILTTPTCAASIAAALRSPTVAADGLTIVGLVLAVSGLAFKLAAVPLHFYVADVYQGAASPVAGLLGFVPKFAGFIAIIRILSAAGWEHSDALFWLLWVLAAATMTVGNTLALMQHNVKRMLAYSGVAHSGYMLLGLAAGPDVSQAAEGVSPLRDGLAGLLFYLPIYGVMNLGAFAALAYFRKSGAEGTDDSVETVEELSGAGRAHPWAALALSICTLGLMGMPLTAGFLGKVYLFSSALSVAPVGAATWRHTAMIVLVVMAAMNAAVAMAYYLRIIASCWLGHPAEGVRPSRCHALQASLALCAGLVVLLFLRPAPLFERSRRAVAEVTPGRMAAVHEMASTPQP